MWASKVGRSGRGVSAARADDAGRAPIPPRAEQQTPNRHNNRRFMRRFGEGQSGGNATPAADPISPPASDAVSDTSIVASVSRRCKTGRWARRENPARWEALCRRKEFDGARRLAARKNWRPARLEGGRRLRCRPRKSPRPADLASPNATHHRRLCFGSCDATDNGTWGCTASTRCRREGNFGHRPAGKTGRYNLPRRPAAKPAQSTCGRGITSPASRVQLYFFGSFSRMVESFTSAPPVRLLSCAASMKAKISSVSACETGSGPPLKNFPSSRAIPS